MPGLGRSVTPRQRGSEGVWIQQLALRFDNDLSDDITVNTTKIGYTNNWISLQ